MKLLFLKRNRTVRKYGEIVLPEKEGRSKTAYGFC